MIVENAHLRILPGRKEEIERALEMRRPILDSADGCLPIGLFRAADHVTANLLGATWQSLIVASSLEELTTHAFVKQRQVVDCAGSHDETAAAAFGVSTPFVHAPFGVVLQERS